MNVLGIQRVRIAWDGGAEDGLLVFHEGMLVVVLVCLDAPFYGSDQGRWHLEAGFGRCDTRLVAFDSFEDALRWTAGRLGLDDADRAIAPALAEFRTHL